jgi:amidase
MKRRAFVTHGSVAVAGIATVSGIACSKETAIKPGTEAQTASNDDFELNEISISELQEHMASGKYTSAAITSLYLNRIESLDKNGPRLNAVIDLNPDALAIANSMDEERKAGKVRGPLHGIPVLIKGNIDTADQMFTTAGSLALANHIASKDSYLVKKLRDAGAVILGKTNLSEWANFRSTKSCSGWSSRGGQTKMPYYIDHNPCGSSSGSGVAVSANFCAIAIGTETDGSITCPASTNGVVGIKPTVGLVSRSGIIPISFTQDTAGPLTRTVTDTAILLNVLAGMDAEDAKTKDNDGKIANDYTTFLDLNALKGKRIGVDKKKYENQFLNRLQESALAAMKQQGAEIVELDYLQSLQDLGDDEFELLKFEFKDGLNEYLSSANAPVKTLKDVIEFNRVHEDEIMPTFKQEIMEECEKKGGLDSKEYQELLLKVHVGSQKIIDALLKDNKLDALGGLTMGPSCAIDTIYGDRWGDVFLTAPAAMAGYPHISVPAGFVYDLPVGFSFYGAAWSDGKLIGMAFAYEQVTKHRKKPEFKRSFLA